MNRWTVSEHNGYSPAYAARTIRLNSTVTNEMVNDHATAAHRFQCFGREFGKPRALSGHRRATNCSTNEPIEFYASADTEFVLGSAVPHPHQLVLGYYSVHTNPETLTAGERRIDEIRAHLQQKGRL
jgi:hypothetical protein